MVTERGRTWGAGTVGERGMDSYTLLCLKRIASKDLPSVTGNSAHVVRQPGWERSLRRMDTCVCVRLSPLAVPLRLARHCQSATLQYK